MTKVVKRCENEMRSHRRKKVNKINAHLDNILCTITCDPRPRTGGAPSPAQLSTPFSLHIFEGNHLSGREGRCRSGQEEEGAEDVDQKDEEGEGGEAKMWWLLSCSMVSTSQ